MRKNFRISVSLLLALLFAFSASVTCLAKEQPFSSKAFTTVITASDLQDEDDNAYIRFASILSLMKKDGLEDPDSLLIGGDYSKVWPDYATPGVMQVKECYTSVYSDESEDEVICIQGNHDFRSCGFTKTGFYDMGSYCLYVINENEFPWNQFLRTNLEFKKLGEDVSDALDTMIEKKDTRPVIIMTHVPLHHSSRTLYGDNMYSSYLFNAINEAAEKLDIVFLFGHNHSGDYDDYIGGSVNFLKPGEKIRIPLPNKIGEDCYTEETLNFTYTNCGYVGYSNNGTEDNSTDKLTVGAIQISENSIRFVRYSEDGFMYAQDLARKTSSVKTDRTSLPEIYSDTLWVIMQKVIAYFEEIFN